MLLAVAAAVFTLQQTTDRASYYMPDRHHRIDVKACEKAIGTIERGLGVTIPQFHYYRVRNGQELVLHGGRADWLGFVLPDSDIPLIYSIKKGCHVHEIVHLAARKLGSPGAFWEEGLAGALGGDNYDWYVSREHARSLGTQNIIRAFQHIDDSPEAGIRWQYSSAAVGFVRYLIDRYGLTRFVRFFTLCALPLESSQRFEQVYGISIETASTQWLAQ